MKDTLYQLLNHDASELPTTEPISDQEVMNIMKRFKEENHTPSVKTKRKPKLSVVLLAAAVSAACVGTATVAAAKLGGFWQTQTVWEQEHTKTEPDGSTVNYSYEKLDHNNYEMLESNAETPNVNAQTENMAITVENCYCDGVNLVCSFKAETTEMPDAVILDSRVKLTIGDKTYTIPEFEVGLSGIDITLLRDETEPSCYYGTLNFRLSDAVTAAQDMTVEFTKVTGYTCGIYTEDNKAGCLELPICVNVPLNPQPELRKTIEVNYSDELMQVKSVEYSAAGIGITYQIPQNSVIVLYDSDGNKIKRQENHYIQDGEWLTEFFSGADTTAVKIALFGKLEGNDGILDELTVELNAE